MNAAQVAIIGAGPAGCYSALALTKAFPEAQVVVLERLPIPYGLIRYGVAADHQGTKAVVAQFDRLFRTGRARFVGNVLVGRDVGVDALLESFDVVVWAGGLSRDRRLNIPGEDLAGVHGSGEVSRAWNGHPLQSWAQLRIGPRVVVVGAGNVSLDLVRLLAKPSSQLAGSDLDETFAATVPLPVTELSVLIRGEPGDVRWDAAMLRELSQIDGARFEIDPDEVATLVAASPNHPPSAALAALGGQPADPAARVVVRFVFGASPVALRGGTRVEWIEVDRRGQRDAWAIDTVLTAIGFQDEAGPTHPRLFKAGWALTGARGTIPALRSAARQLVADVGTVLGPAIGSVSGRRGLAGLGPLPPEVIDFDAWCRIDAWELAQAPADRCRRKLRDLSLLAHILHDSPPG